MNFELTILGSGSALPTSNRFCSAHLLNANERFFLFDCGEGTQIQLRKFKLGFGKLNHIFISHIHGDHVFGLFGLLSTLDLLGRKYPVHMYGPPDLNEIIKFYHRVFSKKPSFDIILHPLEYTDDDIIYEDKMLTVRSFQLSHRIACWGFLVAEKEIPLNLKKEAIEKYRIPIKDIHKVKAGNDLILADGTIIPVEDLTLPPYVPRSFAYITDTLVKYDLAEKLQNVDLIYHEATFSENEVALAVSTFHSTAAQAAKLAKMSNAKKLLLGHFSTRYKNVKILEQEAREVFPETFAVTEGDKYEIKQHRKG